MSEFRLEEWEIGPQCQEPLDGVTQGLTQGKAWRAVEMRPQHFVVFVRGAGEGNWMVRQEEDDQPRVWTPKPPLIKIAFPERGRFFVWNDQMAFVAPDGNGAWLDDQFRSVAPFAGASSPAMIERSGRETFEFLSGELEGESDFAFARKWRRNDANRWDLLLGSPESHQTLLRVLQIILWEVGESVGWVKSNWLIIHWAPGGAYVHSFSGTKSHSEHLKKLLAPWSQFFAFEFLPKSTRNARQQHRCLEQFYNSREAFLEVALNTPPTYHERLEAHFYLRDWLAQNAPDRMNLLEDTER